MKDISLKQNIKSYFNKELLVIKLLKVLDYEYVIKKIFFSL